MRKDFGKIVYERGRVNKYPTAKTAKKLDTKDVSKYEEGTSDNITHLSLRGRVYGWDCNDKIEYTTPLTRFLHKSVGKPWDKIYSEIREVVDARTNVNNFILHWIKWNVTTNCFMGKDGKTVMAIPSHLHKMEVSGFYVHPITNLLCYKKYSYIDNHNITKQMAKNIRTLWVDSACEYRLIRGYNYVNKVNEERWRKNSWVTLTKPEMRWDPNIGESRIYEVGEKILVGSRLANSRELLRIERGYILKYGKRSASISETSNNDRWLGW